MKSASGDNPARWAVNLKDLPSAPPEVAATDNQPTLALANVAASFTALTDAAKVSAEMDRTELLRSGC